MHKWAHFGRLKIPIKTRNVHHLWHISPFLMTFLDKYLYIWQKSFYRCLLFKRCLDSGVLEIIKIPSEKEMSKNTWYIYIGICVAIKGIN